MAIMTQDGYIFWHFIPHVFISSVVRFQAVGSITYLAAASGSLFCSVRFGFPRVRMDIFSVTHRAVKFIPEIGYVVIYHIWKHINGGVGPNRVSDYCIHVADGFEGV
jgi:hypothetical protein